MKPSEFRNIEVIVEIINGSDGMCVSVNNRRIAGPKPFGGGMVLKTFVTNLEELCIALDLPLEIPK